MITTGGKLHIKRALAGYVPAVAQSIAYGIGTKALAVGDTRLQFEVGRADVISTTLDLVNNRIIYKATIPSDVDALISELAIFSAPADAVAGEFASRLISTFDSDTEDWTDSGGTASVFSTTTSRIGSDSLRQTPAASGSRTDYLNQIALDLSGYSNSDLFIFAFNVGNAFTSSLRFRFLTDASNYYDFTFGAQTTGYKFLELAKSAATATGAPDWSAITAIQVTTNSTAGGASQVDFDGIRIEDVDTINPEYVMVSRSLQAPTFVKEEGKTEDVEFSLGVSV